MLSVEGLIALQTILYSSSLIAFFNLLYYCFNISVMILVYFLGLKLKIFRRKNQRIGT